MRAYKVCMALVFSIAFISSCNQKKTAARLASDSDSAAIEQEEQIPTCTYITDKGKKLTGKVLELSNGKKYYAVLLSAKNFSNHK